MMSVFCAEVKTWIDAHPDNVIAIHCKAGKGRTGTMISAFLLYDNVWPNADDAIKYFGQMR